MDRIMNFAQRTFKNPPPHWAVLIGPLFYFVTYEGSTGLLIVTFAFSFMGLIYCLFTSVKDLDLQFAGWIISIGLGGLSFALILDKGPGALLAIVVSYVSWRICEYLIERYAHD